MGRFPLDTWRQISGSGFRLIEELSYRAKPGMWVLLSREFLAKRLAISTRQVTRITTQLQSLGVLQKFQRIFRRKDGSFETHPCLYRLANWAQWKMRQLMGWLTGRKPSADTFSKIEKTSLLDLSFVKNPAQKEALERFAELGKT